MTKTKAASQQAPKASKAPKAAKITSRTKPVAKDKPEAQTAEVSPASPRGKIGVVVDLLRRPEGATAAELMAATGWQAHSVRGAISGAIKRKLGLTVLSAKTEAGRTYRIEAARDAG